MRVLLDTHIALWAVADTKKLSREVIKLLESEQNEVFYSVASVWEVAIKHKLKPEQMPVSEKEFVDLCDQTGFIRLSVKVNHIYLVKTLIRPNDAPKHNDPCDRMLLAQAKYEGLKLITHDSLIPYYGESCVISV